MAPGAGDHGVEQLVVHRVLDQDPSGTGARLPAERERGAGDHVGGGLEVGVGEHDDRILAAELELQALAEPGRVVDLAADSRRAGERHRGDVAVGDEVRTGSEAVHDVQHPTGETGVDERRGEAFAHQRGHRRGLEDNGVAGGERRADLAAGQVERKVPRCDDGDHADRVEQRVDEWCVVARERRPGQPVGLPGVELEVLRGARGLVACVGEGLALLSHHLDGDVGGPLGEQFGSPAEHLGALCRCRPPPPGEPVDRGPHGRVDIGGGRLRGGRTPPGGCPPGCAARTPRRRTPRFGRCRSD